MSGYGVIVRIDESANLGVVISGLKVVEPILVRAYYIYMPLFYLILAVLVKHLFILYIAKKEGTWLHSNKMHSIPITYHMGN